MLLSSVTAIHVHTKGTSDRHGKLLCSLCSLVLLATKGAFTLVTQAQAQGRSHQRRRRRRFWACVCVSSIHTWNLWSKSKRKVGAGKRIFFSCICLRQVTFTLVFIALAFASLVWTRLKAPTLQNNMRLNYSRNTKSSRGNATSCRRLSKQNAKSSNLWRSGNVNDKVWIVSIFIRLQN